MTPPSHIKPITHSHYTMGPSTVMPIIPAHIMNLLASVRLNHLCSSSTDRLPSLQLSRLRPARTTPAIPLNHLNPNIPGLPTQMATVQAHHESGVPLHLHMSLISAHLVQSGPCRPLFPLSRHTTTTLTGRDTTLDLSPRCLPRDSRIVHISRPSLNSNNHSVQGSNSLMYLSRTHISHHMVVLPGTRRSRTVLQLSRVRARCNLNTSLSSNNNHRISLLCKVTPTTVAEMSIIPGRCINQYPRLGQGEFCSPC